jgi:hypothetical protein
MADPFFILPTAEAGDARDELFICVNGKVRNLTAKEAAAPLLPNAPVLSSLSIAPQLACLKRQHADLKARGQHVAARAVKEQTLGLVEAFFDGPDEQQVEHCPICGFLNFAGTGAHATCRATDDIFAMEQLAAARAHVSETLVRWQFEAETTEIPF